MSIAHLLGHAVGFKSETKSAFRIAIVGCGPRGMYCLDSLLRRFNSVTKPDPVEIVIFEATPWCGAGNVYNPNQPEYLRMNFANRFIDAWIRGSNRRSTETRADLTLAASPSTQPSLADWLTIHHPDHADPNGYAPRALVGKYLMECFKQVLGTCPETVTAKIVHARVKRVAPYGTQWAVSLDHHSNWDRIKFDEVVIATGHGGLRNSKLIWGNQKPVSFPVVEDVFPVDDNLSESEVPRRAVVAVRGFGLTWIDAMLAMTEGRGGEFKQINDRLVYRHSGNEPQIILPFCRTGRPMFAKPELGKIRISGQVNDLWASGCDRIRETNQSKNSDVFGTEIWPAITKTAAEVLTRVGERFKSIDESHLAIKTWFEKWIAKSPSTTEVISTMKKSLAVATGRQPLNEAWALGETWRNLYPPLVDRISHGRLFNKANRDELDGIDSIGRSDWLKFTSIAREMEKIAFGPPAINLQKMLALVEANILCFECLTRGLNSAGHFAQAQRDDPIRIDVLINAVIPAASDHSDSSLIGKLRQQNLISMMTECNTIRINQSGQPFNSNGQTVEGLAIFGRATEGCVLGNDTLSRKMHSHIECWAERVVKSSQSQSRETRKRFRTLNQT